VSGISALPTRRFFRTMIFFAAVFGVTAADRGAATDAEVTLSTDRPAVTESSIVVP
jgi:hypothetical protein